MRGRTLATVDHWALEMLRSLVIDVAFLGTNAISVEHSCTTSDPAVAAVKATALKVSRRTVLVAAESKFGESDFCRFAEVRDLDTIVTGVELDPASARQYELLGPRVVRS